MIDTRMPRILVVDDEERVRSLLCDLLTAWVCDPVEASIGPGRIPPESILAIGQPMGQAIVAFSRDSQLTVTRTRAEVLARKFALNCCPGAGFT